MFETNAYDNLELAREQRALTVVTLFIATKQRGRGESPHDKAKTNETS